MMRSEGRSEADSRAHPHATCRSPAARIMRPLPVHVKTGITTRKHLPKSRRCPKPKPAGEAVSSTLRTEEPLTAGAPQMQKLVEMARRALDVDQKAAAAGRRHTPHTLTPSPHTTDSHTSPHLTAP